MFSRKTTTTSTNGFSTQIRKLKSLLEQADAIVIGAGAGLSTAAGFTYDGDRFEKHFADFHQKYGITDMYSGGFYPYSSLEEFWAWWSRAIWVNRYAVSAGQPYLDLLKLIKGRDYFVLTTNVDHQFQLAGFDKNRLFYTQGDYGLWQCSVPCHDKTYDNKEVVKKMVEEQKDQKIPSSLIPHCPKCGEPMTMNLRYDDTFVQDEGWYAAARRYDDFLKNHKDQKVVFLELGVGGNTPSIIKYPFWQMTSENPNAKYVCINAAPSRVPEEIKQRSLCLQADLGKVLHELAESSNG